MLPLLSLVAVGALTVAAVSRSKRRAARLRRSWSEGVGGGLRVVGQRLVAESERVLATEEVPLDNRFGNQAFVSEHEFFRSATVAIETDCSVGLAAQVGADLLGVLKADLQGRLARKLGVKGGTQISRHIRLKFTAAPGKRVLYRVVWQQTAQRGVFEIGVGRQLHEVPYLVTYGLAHAVESIDMELES
ncbi:MAG: hypothetical protein HQL90_06735 [Magnetococcales bacterium]|nr:hypothetical protein [Magnetococcales bacterium]